MTQPDQIEALTARLLADLATVHARIVDEITNLTAAWFGQPPPVRLRRLRTLERHLLALADQADTIAAREVLQATQGAYETGAWSTAISMDVGAEFTSVDVDAVTQIAQDTMRDLLHATRGVREDVKELVRDLARDAVRHKVYTGQTAVQAGRDLAQRLAERGVTAVVYADGRRVSLPTYAEMVVRTKTAEAYQEGGFNQGERLGVQWWEVMDGPDCGWASHDDPKKADGLIVPLEDARRHPISHPNCRRSSSPRPDVVSADDATRTAPTSADRADAVAQAAVRAQAAANRATALSTTPARRSASVDVAAGTVPNTAAGRRFAATLRRHAG